jgi:fructuronate reductase
MVDRIVPASSDADRAEVRQALGGVADEAVVTAEPFSQWVLEENFGGPMPDLAAVGVELVGEVAPYERMKLRLLNGSHSAIAYLGQVAGLEHVADVMADPALSSYVERLMIEIADAVPGIDAARIADYRASLLARWRNPAIRHRTAQIAMDGSQKIPQRWLATLTALRQDGRRTPGLAFALAGWFRYLGGVGERGPIAIAADPMADTLTALCRPEPGAGPQDRIVAAMFDRSGLFPPALAQDRALRGAVAAAFAAIVDRGVREASRASYWASS